MANIRKSFNFKTGLQVDNDNFVVNSNGLVGIGTSVPQGYLLNVYGDSRVTGLVTSATLHSGVGTVTTLTASTLAASTSTLGVASVTSLQVGSSPVVTNLIGYAYTAFETDNGGVGLHTVSHIGINTTVSPSASDPELSVYGNVNVTGVVTASSFSGDVAATNLSGTIDNARLPSNINVSGVVTATTFVGNVTGTATTASSLSGTPSITVDDVTAAVITATKLIANTIEVPSTGITTVSKLLHVGTGGTAFAALDSGRIGVGTAVPGSELQIRKASGSLLEVVSDSGEARISVGNSVDVGNSSAILRFGNSANTFDVINRDTGNINMILHGGGSGIDTGRFDWIYGQTNVELMSLTRDGRLGIGITNPTNDLHVVGTSTVTGNAFIGGSLTVAGVISGSVSLQDIIASNTSVTSGISTFNDVQVDSKLIVSIGASVGIGTDNPIEGLDARTQTGLFLSVGVNTNVTYNNAVFSADGNAVISSGVGIGTTSFDPAGAAIQAYAPLIDVNEGHLNIKSNSTVGFDTSDPKSVFDFSNVGSATTRPVMVVPNINNTTITGIAQTPTGALIFNTSTSKFQGYTGTAWVDFH